eukprot:259679_1
MVEHLLLTWLVINTICCNSVNISKDNINALLRGEYDYRRQTGKALYAHEYAEYIGSKRNIIGHKKQYYSAKIGTNNDGVDAIGNQKYSDKKQIIALILSVALGAVGAGRFYIGDHILGAWKLTLYMVLICAPCAVLLCKRCKDTERNTTLSNSNASASNSAFTGCAFCTFLCGAIALFSWCVADIVMFAMNQIPDRDGFILEPI